MWIYYTNTVLGSCVVLWAFCVYQVVSKLLISYDFFGGQGYLTHSLWQITVASILQFMS